MEEGKEAPPSSPGTKTQRQFPTEEARQLESLAQENWQEHLLLFSQVKNKVLVVNSDVYIPLQLEEGKPSPLGLFAKAAFQERPREIATGEHALEVWPASHARSALLGRIVFADSQGRIYRDIDLKGIGYLGFNPFTAEKKVKLYIPGIEYSFLSSGKAGLLDRESALFDYQLSEEFLQAGIRTHRALAIIELEEIIIRGNKISLEKATEMGILDKDSPPVVEVRAYGLRARVGDIGSSLKMRRRLLEDAKSLISQEFGLLKTFSTKDYFQWFAKTLGANVGLMHKNGWVHNNLINHNITLDCRIVDLDTVTHLGSEEECLKDLEKASWVVFQLVGSGTHPADWEKHPLVKQFQESYEAAFSPEERERYFREEVLQAV